MKPILFIHLPRTGGTFIREYAKRTKLINYYANYKQRDGHQSARLTKDPEKYFSFGLVRNPFDWYVSQYFYLSREGKELETGIFNGVDAGLCGVEFRNRFPTLTDWIKYGVNIPMFFETQIYDYMFCSETGRLLLDYVGKFEKLYDEIDHVLELNGIIPENKLRDFDGYRNASERGDYHQYFTSEAINIIMEKDKKLLDRYEYRY